ncbi:MAG: transposase [Candidatus Omnitrophota bacterium]
MSQRKVPLVEDEVYHIYTKSIAGFKIFKNKVDYNRMLEEIRFYTIENPPCKFCVFKSLQEEMKPEIFPKIDPSEKLIDILAYCLMPTHIHFVLKQLKENGISKFIGRILQSYSTHFNIKHKRKGPLWQGRFQNVRVENDNQLLHLTRYLHLNPVAASLTDMPMDWKFSSYKEYLGQIKENEKLCNFSGYFDLNPDTYEKFVSDHVSYQKERSVIESRISRPGPERSRAGNTGIKKAGRG